MEAQTPQPGVTAAPASAGESSPVILTGAAAATAADHPVTHNYDSSSADVSPTNVNNFSCCICLEDHPNENITTADGCGHYFCFQCIDKWTNKSRRCPTCRKVVSAIVIHQVAFPVNNPQLKIKVRNTRGWHRNFLVHRKRDFIDAVLDFYAPRNPVREADSGEVDYRYNNDVVFFHNDKRIVDEFATPKKIGMKEGDVLWIHHKVTVLFNMPDSKDRWDMKYETNWWDTPLEEFIQTYFDKIELDSNDYWLSYNNAIINMVSSTYIGAPFHFSRYFMYVGTSKILFFACLL